MSNNSTTAGGAVGSASRPLVGENRPNGQEHTRSVIAGSVTILVRRLAATAALPEKATPGAMGADVRAAEPVYLAPGERALVKLGFAVEIPAGYEIQVRPRSGLAVKHGVTVLNAPGTIDSDFRGECAVILINHGLLPFAADAGERIAQFVAAPAAAHEVRYVWADTLTETERGEGGFGSTGTN